MDPIEISSDGLEKKTVKQWFIRKLVSLTKSKSSAVVPNVLSERLAYGHDSNGAEGCLQKAFWTGVHKTQDRDQYN